MCFNVLPLVSDQYSTHSSTVDSFFLFRLPQSPFSVRNLVKTVECVRASTGVAVPKDLSEVSVKQVCQRV